jgi:uncharacterized protein YbjQ (UPF0145 family)
VAREITIAVGESFADRHDTYREQLGDEYTQRMRKLVEDEIHTLTQEIERQTEAALQQSVSAASEENEHHHTHDDELEQDAGDPV